MSERPPKHVLEYAPRKRRCLLKLLRYAVMVAVCTGLAWWGRVVVHDLRISWKHQAYLNYSMPPGCIVYSEQPEEVAALLKLPDYRPVMIEGEVVAAAHIPPLWLPLRSHSREVHALLYMHEVPDRAGGTQLGIVSLRVSGLKRYEEYAFGTETMAAFGQAPFFKPTWGGWQNWYGLLREPRRGLRIFAGQPDPLDKTRFTIKYERDGKPGEIVGRDLSGYMIELVPRDP